MMIPNFTLVLSVLLTLFYVSASKVTPTWDHFTFTQEWPQTACIMGKQEKKVCRIPPDITSFVIHGLWPSKGWKTEGPTHCSDVHFDMNAIKNLTAELNSRWPNLYSNTKKDSFWNHEWSNHGTCAVSLNATGTEYLYFKKALDLMAKYNISKYLDQAQIFPDDKKPYSTKNVLNVLKTKLNVKVDLQCMRDNLGSTSRKSILAEIRICMDTKFNLMDCKTKTDQTLYFRSTKKSYTSPCKPTGEFIFPQIKRNY